LENHDAPFSRRTRSVHAVAAPAFAGTVITSEVSAPNVAGNSVVYYIEPDRVRMEYPGHIVIFRADQDTEYMLAPAEKKFRRMTPETMKQSAAAIAKMFELLKSMPPEQRAQVEKRMPPEQRAQFERIMTPERLAQAEKMMAGQAPKSDYRKAGGTASVGKWRCERVEVKGRHREYTLRTTDAGQRARYRLAILRQVEQGNGRRKRPRAISATIYSRHCS
jgi:hypothetical protein